MPGQPPLTVTEAARRCGHVRRAGRHAGEPDPRTVLHWIRSGQLPALNIARDAGPGHRPRWRIDPADLDAFLTARAKRPRPAPARRRKPSDMVIEFF